MPEDDLSCGFLFLVVDTQPEIIGGWAALQRELKYPEIARKAGIEGRVILQYIVNKRGDITDLKVTRSAHELLDAEAVRAMSLMQFEPGLHDGEPVCVRMSMPIAFRLS